MLLQGYPALSLYPTLCCRSADARRARAQHVEEMDGGRFEKLCRDCGLVDRKAVTSTEVDLAFARAKAKGARRLSFERFLDALALLAERKGASLAELAAAVLAARGPCVTGTRADYVKFHDDKARARIPRRAHPGRSANKLHVSAGMPPGTGLVENERDG